MIKLALVKYCQEIEAGTDWEQYLGEVAMGLRSAVSRAHGKTPYSVLFGREPQLPSSFRMRDFDLEAALMADTEAAAVEYSD